MKLLSALTVFLLFLAVESRRDRTVTGILKKYHWRQHLLIVFTNKPLNQRYLHQKKILKENDEGLRKRDILVGTFETGKSWTAAFRRYFSVPKRLKFAVILLTKDGLVKWKSRRMATLKTDIFPLVDRLPSLFHLPARPHYRTRRTHSVTSTQPQVRRTARSWVV